MRMAGQTYLVTPHNLKKVKKQKVVFKETGYVQGSKIEIRLSCDVIYWHLRACGVKIEIDQDYFVR